MLKKKQAAKKEEVQAEAQKDESLSGPSPISIHLNNVTPPNPATKGATLQELIEKNIKWTQVVYEQNRRIKRRLSWMVFGGYLRLFLIIAPIIIGIIYLPGIFETFLEQYKSLLTDPSGGGLNAGVIEQAIKLFGSQ